MLLDRLLHGDRVASTDEDPVAIVVGELRNAFSTIDQTPAADSSDPLAHATMPSN